MNETSAASRETFNDLLQGVDFRPSANFANS